ncbi:hypothetical protein EG329_014441 [Mollisiaceae sp. DMI_Dod_QoI]|nr:hypothetical protein EG329_014441 [Helotiales sp. DMI_Dod_QoI]
MKLLLFTLLTAFSLTSVAADSTCTSSNAHPIDADVAFIAFWTILAVDWLAIAVIVKRSAPSSLSKRGSLTCSATEECLSFKSSPFCYDKTAYTFHAVDGTAGNFDNGDYTLPDGRQGNMYHGPYPTLSSGEVTALQTSATATSKGTMITSGALSVSITPTKSSDATPTSTAGALGLVSTANGGGATSITPVATQSSVALLKNDAHSVKGDGGHWNVLLQVFGIMIVGL